VKYEFLRYEIKGPYQPPHLRRYTMFARILGAQPASLKHLHEAEGLSLKVQTTSGGSSFLSIQQIEYDGRVLPAMETMAL
jgi:hypothetical protein